MIPIILLCFSFNCRKKINTVHAVTVNSVCSLQWFERVIYRFRGTSKKLLACHAKYTYTETKYSIYESFIYLARHRDPPNFRLQFKVQTKHIYTLLLLKLHQTVRVNTLRSTNYERIENVCRWDSFKIEFENGQNAHSSN